MSTETTVLVVDDEPDVAEAYALKLRDAYETELAFGGEEALEKAGPDTDAMLLDRRMPDIHGDDVLAELRERGFDFPIVMVTAVDPDLNILEMDFDDYLCKPVDKETLTATVDQHLDTRQTTGTDPELEEFFSLLSKLSVLESELRPNELEDDEEFQRLKRRATERAERLRETVDDFEELVETHRSLERGSRSTL